MIKHAKVGKFTVQVPFGAGKEAFDLLRIAQHGCAIMRCEHQAYNDTFEIIAEHPDFSIVADGQTLPEYDCVFTKSIGGEVVRTFKPKGS